MKGTVKHHKTRSATTFVDDYARNVFGSILSPTTLAHLPLVWKNMDWITSQQLADRNQHEMTDAVLQGVELFGFGSTSSQDGTLGETSHIISTGHSYFENQLFICTHYPKQVILATALGMRDVRLKSTALLDFYVPDSKGSCVSQLHS